MSATEAETGRYRQRRRTRAAIVGATADLLRSGVTAPGVSEIAEAADVSRRTIYQYFPTVEQLILDATVGLLSETAVEDAIDAADPGGDPADRVSAMIRALAGLSSETMPIGRSLIRLTVDAPADGTEQPRRGYRRIAWIERAIEPLRDQLDEAGFQRLVSALAMVIGWEALIVLQDLRGLSADDQADVSSWAARALIEAALSSAGGGPADPGRASPAAVSPSAGPAAAG